MRLVGSIAPAETINREILLKGDIKEEVECYAEAMRIREESLPGLLIKLGLSQLKEILYELAMLLPNSQRKKEIDGPLLAEVLLTVPEKQPHLN